jgi:hypothetical protein
MNTLSIRRALRSLLPGSATMRPVMVLQPVGFEASQRDTLPAMLDVVGRELGLVLALDDSRGDAVLAEQDFVNHVSPQVLSAFLDERPLVAVSMPPAGAARGDGPLAQTDLTRQLRTLRDSGGWTSAAAASTLPPSSGFDSQFDSRPQTEKLAEFELDPDRAQLLNTLRRGLVDPTEPLLAAGYGPQAALVIDFATGIATLDERADQHLRVTREVPFRASGWSAATSRPPCRRTGSSAGRPGRVQRSASQALWRTMRKRAQRLDQPSFAVVEVAELLVAFEQRGQLLRHGPGVARHQHPQVLHRRAHAGVVQVDDVRAAGPSRHSTLPRWQSPCRRSVASGAWRRRRRHPSSSACSAGAARPAVGRAVTKPSASSGPAPPGRRRRRPAGGGAQRAAARPPHAGGR